ncbi:hypothetical protein I4F81_002163 [Pyropia yezoensis]|uniref:Uncharacterized protein n=1 Tax=Pyropia yezoensis TaxID=2788 RepID=A0ACC3BNS6_PYRYE|nr:hypothetical protein I4F81_002163 [Neopyropia yezoensis]
MSRLAKNQPHRPLVWRRPPLSHSLTGSIAPFPHVHVGPVSLGRGVPPRGHRDRVAQRGRAAKHPHCRLWWARRTRWRTGPRHTTQPTPPPPPQHPQPLASLCSATVPPLVGGTLVTGTNRRHSTSFGTRSTQVGPLSLPHAAARCCSPAPGRGAGKQRGMPRQQSAGNGGGEVHVGGRGGWALARALANASPWGAMNRRPALPPGPAPRLPLPGGGPELPRSSGGLLSPLRPPRRPWRVGHDRIAEWGKHHATAIREERLCGCCRYPGNGIPKSARVLP